MSPVGICDPDFDVDRGFFCLPSSSCVFCKGWSPAVPVFFICRFPQVPLGLWVRSGGGLWSSGDIRATSPGFLGGYGSWGITDVATCCCRKSPTAVILVILFVPAGSLTGLCLDQAVLSFRVIIIHVFYSCRRG